VSTEPGVVLRNSEKQEEGVLYSLVFLRADHRITGEFSAVENTFITYEIIILP
jgi:hypothetical protein